MRIGSQGQVGPIRRREGYDRYLVTGLMSVRHQEGFYPKSARELSEAEAIIAASPRYGAAEHVQEVMNYQRDHGYPKGPIAAGIALTREYGRFFRSARYTSGLINQAREMGMRQIKASERLIPGARAIIQLADTIALVEGEEVAVPPLDTKYFSHAKETEEYVRERLAAIPTRQMVALSQEALDQHKACEIMWVRSLRSVGTHLPVLAPNVEDIFKLSPPTVHEL